MLRPQENHSLGESNLPFAHVIRRLLRFSPCMHAICKSKTIVSGNRCREVATKIVLTRGVTRRTVLIAGLRRGVFATSESVGSSLRAGSLPNEDFHDTIPAGADDEPAILAPAHIADAFTAHRTVGDNILGADALFQGPEADAGVMTS